MASFRSEVFTDFFSEKFGYSDKSLYIGSCFTENIGKKLALFKFPVCINPFGILYNPLSIARAIKRIISPFPFETQDLIFFNEKYSSFFHHGRFSGTNADDVLANINHEMESAHNWLKESKLLFITFGTSWVYKHIRTNQVVANCHKIPAKEFDHYALNVQEILEIYNELIGKILQFNPKIKLIFTVSPVRHWKDGPVNNLYSKSVLVVAIHELLKKHDGASYFPSYEIMLDDLRDYRFYADDLFHPNQQGIDYIWEKFRDCYVTNEAKEFAIHIDKILASVAHKPFYPNTLAYKKFIQKNLAIIDNLKKNYPKLDFSREESHFKSEYLNYFP